MYLPPMLPEDRKRKSEETLTWHGASINPGLPIVEAEEEVQLRKPEEVARRIICLTSVVAAAKGVNRRALKKWLKREGVWAYLSGDERSFLDSWWLDRTAKIQFSWRVEAIWLLLWALSLVDDLSVPTGQCNVQA